jgi:hypothetical protein
MVRPTKQGGVKGRKECKMATVTREEILAEIASYRAENGRPCPAKHLVAKFGAGAESIIAALKDDGILVGKRGRTGGLVPADVAAAVDAAEAPVVDDTADQFAALAAKLAEAEMDQPLA